MDDGRLRAGRRTFLVLGAGSVLGGCVRSTTLGGREPPRDEPSQPTANGETETRRANRTEATATNRSESRSTTTKPGGVTIGIDSNESEPQATATVGSGTNEQRPGEYTAGIEVWNNAETARRITVSVEKKGPSGEPLLRKTYRYKPDAYIDIDVSEPGEYAVTVGIAEKDSKTVGFAVDDCNDQSLFITVRENGTIQSNSISTLVGCQVVTVTTDTDD